MSGYDTMFRALQILGDEYDKRTQYADIDWGATLRKIFGRKRDIPNVNDESGALASLNASGQPMTPEEQANYNEFSRTIPRTKQNYIDPSQYSPDNPLLEEVAKVNKGGFLVRKPTGALMAGLEDYEQNKGRQSIAQQLSELELERRQLENEALRNPQPQFKDGYITIDENVLNSIPAKYRGFYRPGMQVKTSELTGLIEDPEKTSPESNVNLSRQYQAVQDAYAQYVKAVKERDEYAKPLRFDDWIRQPENAGALAIHNQFMNSNLRSLPSRLSTQTPEQKAAKDKEIASRSEAGRKLGYKKNGQYSENDWWQADKIVSSEGSYTQAFVNAMQDPSVPDSVIRALTDRYNRLTNKKYTPEQLFAKLNKQPSNKGGAQLANNK
jgi:hypothetical protein